MLKKNNNIDKLYIYKWLLKRFGFIKSIFFQFIDRLIYQKQSQFLLHPWSAHRTPYKMILLYNRFGRILFATKEFIALVSHGKIVKKSIQLEGYDTIENDFKRGDYDRLWPQSPLLETKKISVSSNHLKKMKSSLKLAYTMENNSFDKTKEWNRTSTLFKSYFLDENGEIHEERLRRV